MPQQRRRFDGYRLAVGVEREIGPLQFEAPLSVQLLQRDPVDTRKSLLETVVLPDRLVQIRDPPVTEALAQILLELPAQRVGDESVRVSEPLQSRDIPAQHQIADEHVVFAVLLRAPALGQPLRPPERDIGRPETRILSVGPAQLGQLEEVHQLVPDRVPKVLIAAVERERDPPLEKLGESRDAFGQERRGHVRLLEMLV